ncbi:hypothetical protein ACGFX2_28760 [Streptomyces goshikiensis]|uniref:hypothetical protein n=1 Tax=Streptomyces goshikiensis TaxID=1942 RepID=UPI00372052BF
MKATDSHQDAPGRLSRHLIAIDVRAEPTPDHYVPQVEWLDPTHMIGRADVALIHLFEAVRDGGSVHKNRYGKEFRDDVSDDPDLGATFYDLMAHAQSAYSARRWNATTGPVRHILDGGGADSDLIAVAPAKEPGISATLLELPGPAARVLLVECADQSPSRPDPGFTSGDLRRLTRV